ncbi:hypothetical protein BDQ94DRAFT_176025 [Aspergillus welwitschiae]|uniref:Ferric oxidoreductase domain-containing protein n=1 Tax=Aspergillus welwitschiae TaxID=1341132 RepID=A0A3F3PJK1_9EURO|nr:hypothetical protein BDQ94DRAFT_176025 [Aspergillus welwitschiae]RDH26963.1 hypothetical protein BDQ94DRAFT_176025 [Aspergillus welwitschiae]
MLLGANNFVLFVSAHGWADVQQRAAKLAILNLSPLSTGLTFGLLPYLLGVSHSAVAWSHRWFGRVMAAHSLLHGAIAIARADNPIPSMRHDWVPVLAAAAILMMIPVTLHAVVRRHCQVAMRIHYLLAVTAMVALAYHTWDQGVPHLHIRPGQYVYVWLPHAVFRSCLQLRPFYVAYWDDPPGPRILYVLTRPRASSLSTRLYLREWLQQCRQPALLLGPYGRSIDFSLFGTIVFIVEDIGASASCPGERAGAGHNHQCWLGDWMQDLLDLGRGEFKIPEFRLLYCLTKGTSVNPGDAFGEQINLSQGPLVAREIDQVCARQSIRQQVQDVVQPQTGPDIKLFDLEPDHVKEAPCRNKDTATAPASSDL